VLFLNVLNINVVGLNDIVWTCNVPSHIEHFVWSHIYVRCWPL